MFRVLNSSVIIATGNHYLFLFVWHCPSIHLGPNPGKGRGYVFQHYINLRDRDSPGCETVCRLLRSFNGFWRHQILCLSISYFCQISKAIFNDLTKGTV